MIVIIKHIVENIKRWIWNNTHFQLKPGKGIRCYPTSDYKWESTGVDPVFKLMHSNRHNFIGWYMLEFAIHSNIKFHTTRLYVDYGSGFSKENSFVTQGRSGRLVKRLIRFPKIPKELRIMPTEKKCLFSINRLRLVKIAEFYAQNLMLKKLRNNHFRFKNKTDKLILNELKRELAKSPNKDIPQRPNKCELIQKKYDEIFQNVDSTIVYEEWIEHVEKPTLGNRKKAYYKFSNFAYQPLFSVLMPTYNPDEKFLRDAIESVLSQNYPKWELCITDNVSTNPRSKEIIWEYTLKDSRLKIFFQKENKNISEASNSALTMAEGDFVTFLDHDDTLSPQALFNVAEALNKDKYLDFLYSDEDFIDAEGCRFNPHFKSDWNPELILGHNYVANIFVLRHSLVDKIGGFRKRIEGAEKYDLVLRASRATSPGRIHHIPKVLYHCRDIEKSSVSSKDKNFYQGMAGLKALEDHVKIVAKGSTVSRNGLSDSYRVDYPLSGQLPKVSLLIPTHNGFEILSNCIKTILDKSSYPNYEIIIIDNKSYCSKTLSYLDTIQDNNRVRVISYNSPFNYSSINNFGVRNADGDIIGFINNDVEVISSGWLEEMVSLSVIKENGCIGAKLYYPDNTIQHAGVIIGLKGYAAYSHKYFHRDHPGYFNRLILRQNLSAVTAACMIVRKEIFYEIDGFDEKLAVAYNDVDFCMRVRDVGYKNVYTPYAELYHHESKSRGEEDTYDKTKRFNFEKEYFKRRWGDALLDDPFYNPNLTKEKENFSIL